MTRLLTATLWTRPLPEAFRTDDIFANTCRPGELLGMNALYVSLCAEGAVNTMASQIPRLSVSRNGCPPMSSTLRSSVPAETLDSADIPVGPGEAADRLQGAA